MTRDRDGESASAAQPVRTPRQPGLRRRPRATRQPSAARTTAGPTATPASSSDSRSSRVTAAASSTWRWDGFRASTPTGASSSAASPTTAPDLWSISVPPPARSTGWRGCRRREGRADRGLAAAPDGANWKLLAENETDGYHPQFVHGSIFGVTGSTIGAALQRYLDRGHPQPGQRAQRERSAPGVPQVRRADAVVRHHRTAGAQLRRGDARTHGEDAERS
jgi:hypothetical protein